MRGLAPTGSGEGLLVSRHPLELWSKETRGAGQNFMADTSQRTDNEVVAALVGKKARHCSSSRAYAGSVVTVSSRAIVSAA